MKRSEMLGHMTNILKLPRPEPLTPEALAEELLDCREAQGMAPPEIESEFYDRANCDYHRVHEWEKEE